MSHMQFITVINVPVIMQMQVQRMAEDSGEMPQVQFITVVDVLVRATTSASVLV